MLAILRTFLPQKFQFKLEICDPAKVIFSPDVIVDVLLIYITCRIFCAKGITVSQIFCELLHFEILILENLEKSDF
jgi:hypothetical protein